MAKHKKKHTHSKQDVQTQIIIKTPEQLAAIRTSGQYLTDLLGFLYTRIKPGQTLREIENMATEWIVAKKVISGAFKGYKSYPTNLCLSVNDCLVHGVPTRYILKTGDLLKVDCGITYNGGISDAAFSLVVGGAMADMEAQHLIDTTKYALDTAVQIIKPACSIRDFGSLVEEVVTGQGFSVIENLTGHGVGSKVHEKPYIYNCEHDDMKKITFQTGMVVALEPITALTSYRYRDTKPNTPRNNWNLYTEHGDIGAQWEYTVIITEYGHEIVAGLQELP